MSVWCTPSVSQYEHIRTWFKWWRAFTCIALLGRREKKVCWQRRYDACRMTKIEVLNDWSSYYNEFYTAILNGCVTCVVYDSMTKFNSYTYIFIKCTQYSSLSSRFKNSKTCIKKNDATIMNDLRLRSHSWQWPQCVRVFVFVSVAICVCMRVCVCWCVYAPLTDRYSEFLTAFITHSVVKEARRKEQQIIHSPNELPVHLHWHSLFWNFV